MESLIEVAFMVAAIMVLPWHFRWSLVPWVLLVGRALMLWENPDPVVKTLGAGCLVVGLVILVLRRYGSDPGRKLTVRAAEDRFALLWDKALAGDQYTLALFADLFGVGDLTTAEGRGRFVEQMKLLSKRLAGDRFVVAISRIGIRNQLTSPNYTKAHRLRLLLRFLISITFLIAMDPALVPALHGR